MTGFFKGVATAMITPFTQTGVNFDELGKLLEYQIEGGVAAVVILGTTGEPATMTEDEKKKVIEYSVKKVNGRIKVIVGVGSNCTSKAVENARLAEEFGADGLLAVTPYYNKCTQEGLVLYYKAICEATKLPVIAYCVPSRTGVNILPETAEKLSLIPNLAGIKEASGNMSQVCETMRRVRGKTDIYSGEDALNLPILAVGGAGVISVVSNLAPAAESKLCELVANNELERANELADSLLPLASACFTEVNPIPVKAACNMLGFKCGTPRLPLTELTGKNKENMRAALKGFGLLK